MPNFHVYSLLQNIAKSDFCTVAHRTYELPGYRMMLTAEAPNPITPHVRMTLHCRHSAQRLHQTLSIQLDNTSDTCSLRQSHHPRVPLYRQPPVLSKPARVRMAGFATAPMSNPSTRQHTHTPLTTKLRDSASHEFLLALPCPRQPSPRSPCLSPPRQPIFPKRHSDGSPNAAPEASADLQAQGIPQGCHDPRLGTLRYTLGALASRYGWPHITTYMAQRLRA